MMEIQDVDGDVISCGRFGGLYELHDSERLDLPFARLTPKVARTLAADLIAFADSQERENDQ